MVIYYSVHRTYYLYRLTPQLPLLDYRPHNVLLLPSALLQRDLLPLLCLFLPPSPAIPQKVLLCKILEHLEMVVNKLLSRSFINPVSQFPNNLLHKTSSMKTCA